MKPWNNNIWFGLFLGIFSPLLALYFNVKLFHHGESFNEMMVYYMKGNVLTHVISLSVLVNLAIFFACLHLQKDQSAKGVLGATLLYAFLIVGLKFL